MFFLFKRSAENAIAYEKKSILRHLVVFVVSFHSIHVLFSSLPFFFISHFISFYLNFSHLISVYIHIIFCHESRCSCVIVLSEVWTAHYDLRVTDDFSLRFYFWILKLFQILHSKRNLYFSVHTTSINICYWNIS